MNSKRYFYNKMKRLCSIEIVPDEYSESPREFDNIAHLYIGWDGYKGYGDSFKDANSLIEEYASKYTDLTEDEISYEKSNSELIVEIQKSKDVLVIPIYGYEHSGFTITLLPESGELKYPYTDRFDAGLAGYVFVEKEDLTNAGIEFNDSNFRDIARKIAEQEVEVLEDFLQGKVYAYTIKTKDGEVIDSCGGIYSNNYGEELFKDIIKETGISEDTIFYDDIPKNEEVKTQELTVSSLKNYYFTFGSDEHFPFGRDDYVVVKANNIKDATLMFKNVYPNIDGSDCLNCAFYYTEAEWTKENLKEQYYKDVVPANILIASKDAIKDILYNEYIKTTIANTEEYDEVDLD